MINFILHEDNSYFFDNIKILQFILLRPLNKVKESVNKLLQEKTIALDNFFIKTRKATIIQNYSIAIGLLYANFEIYEFGVLLFLIICANLICLIINQ